MTNWSMASEENNGIKQWKQADGFILTNFLQTQYHFKNQPKNN